MYKNHQIFILNGYVSDTKLFPIAGKANQINYEAFDFF